MTWQKPQVNTAAPGQPAPRRRGRGLIITSVVLIVFALVGAIGCGFTLVSEIGDPVSETLQSPARQTPVKTSMELTKDTYTVYERVDSVEESPTLKPSQVTVT